MADTSRRERVAEVLEAVTMLGREIASERRAPFSARTLTRTQVETLFVLARARRPVTPGRLAAILGVTAGAVTQLVDGLRMEGLVEDAPNPADARSRVIRLTRNASEEVSGFERAVVERMLPRFDPLNGEELEALAQALGRVADEQDA